MILSSYTANIDEISESANKNGKLICRKLKTEQIESVSTK